MAYLKAFNPLASLKLSDQIWIFSNTSKILVFFSDCFHEDWNFIHDLEEQRYVITVTSGQSLKIHLAAKRTRH